MMTIYSLTRRDIELIYEAGALNAKGQSDETLNVVLDHYEGYRHENVVGLLFKNDRGEMVVKNFPGSGT